MSAKKLRKNRRPSGPSSLHSTPLFSAVSKCSAAIGKGTVSAEATSLEVTAGPSPSSSSSSPTNCPILRHTCTHANQMKWTPPAPYDISVQHSMQNATLCQTMALWPLCIHSEVGGKATVSVRIPDHSVQHQDAATQSLIVGMAIDPGQLCSSRCKGNIYTWHGRSASQPSAGISNSLAGILASLRYIGSCSRQES